MKTSEEKALQSVTILGEWTKKMLMILFIIAFVLILVLLVLVVTNRRRIAADYKKLVARVDNTKEAIDLEIKEVLTRHETDITALKDVLEKGKK
jgi:glucose uptake protein GlcU